MSAIEISCLSRDYGNNKGVFDLSFSVGSGECFGFLGPNGAGKTTTIRHLMGFLKPQSGSCKISGLDCWKDRAVIQKKLGYIPGEIAFFDDMTGAEFLDFSAKYRGIADRDLIKKMLERFELNAKGKLKKMSKGMKQKVGIVAAFMNDPDVIILDEPTSGLDPLMQSRFIDLILEEKARGKTILMSSHLFEEVEKTCDRVSIIKDGRLAAIDKVIALKAAQVKKFVITFEKIEQAAKFAKEPLEVESVSQNSVTVVIRSNFKTLISTMNNYDINNISEKNQTLEEVFMQYYGGNSDVKTV